jgi:hypothetical protein
MKKTIFLLSFIIVLIFSSCSRYYSTEYAASHSMKCGTGIGKRSK